MQITYQPSVGAPVPVSGVFDETYVLETPGEVSGVEALRPAVFLRLADLPVDLEIDDPTLIIKGVTYRVFERQSAGFGAIVLVLRKVT